MGINIPRWFFVRQTQLRDYIASCTGEPEDHPALSDEERIAMARELRRIADEVESGFVRSRR